MTGTCGCCTGVHVVAPREVTNRPGLPRLAYRIGTHGSFMASMLARLASSDYPELARLTARDPSDPSIGFLDAWATIADVLTFYQERIANEGYLRTAEERRSILELGRLVGWALRPGVSATAYLSFTVDPDPQDPGKDRFVTIPEGTQVQSVPDPPQLPATSASSFSLPQTFETFEDLPARALWSRLEPRRRRPAWIQLGSIDALGALYLDGVATQLKPGNRLVLDFGGTPRVRTVAAVTPDQTAGVTVVALLGSLDQAMSRLVGDLVADLAGLPQPPGKSAAELEIAVKPLVDAALAAATPEALVSGLEPAIATLTEALLGFEARGWTNARDWARAALDVLEPARGAAQAIGLLPFAPPVAVDASTLLVDAPMPVPAGTQRGPFGIDLGALRKPPSIPPPNRRLLQRDVATLFRRGSDLGPRLLTQVSPAFAPLYQALAGAAPPASSLTAVSALRIRCQPFGATAPLRPIVDDRGVITGSEEWPIKGEITLGVRGLVVGTDRFDSASVSVDAAGASFEATLTGPDTVAFDDLGSAKVDISDTRLIASFAGAGQPGPGGMQLPELTTELDLEHEGDVVVTYSTAPGIKLQVFPGSTTRRTLDAGRYLASLDSGAKEVEVATAVARVPMAPDRYVLDLDAVYEGILPETWVVVERPGELALVTTIVQVDTVARADYALTATVTRLTLAKPWLAETDRLLTAVRNATVYVLSELQTLALEPVDDDICGDRIELQRIYPGLESGRWIIVEGERTDIAGTSGVIAAELAMVAGVSEWTDPERDTDTLHTLLELARPLAYCYRRATAQVHGNVQKATHGETRRETLGSGDAGRSLQSFALRAKPLTHLPDSSPLGAASALEARVDGIRWAEARDLVDLGPRDRGYVLRTDDDDATTLIFGTGERGATPATGQENVTAVYRTGTGKAGNVAAGKLSQLTTRPLGVSGAVNPLAATGGADRESLEQGRRNLPLGVLALDRLVSVLDYEDFARARAGIGQASAVAVSDGSRRVVHLTIAGAGDAPIDPSSDLYRELRRALAEAGDPSVPVVVAVRELSLLVIAADIRIDPDRRWEDVEPVIRTTLLDTFGFERRRLGQDVLLSEVQAAIGRVPGVIYSDVNVLAAVPESTPPGDVIDLALTLSVPASGRLHIETARFAAPKVRVAAEDAGLTAGDRDAGVVAVTTSVTLTAIASEFGVPIEPLVRLNPALAGRPLADGTTVLLSRGLRPAQIALLSPAIPDTLILKRLPS